MNVEDAILKRESIRAYQDKPVSPDDVDKIVEAGRWAPNAGPFQISVVRNADLLKKINDRAHNNMLNSGNEFLKQRASLPGYQHGKKRGAGQYLRSVGAAERAGEAMGRPGTDPF